MAILEQFKYIHVILSLLKYPDVCNIIIVCLINI